MGCFDVAHIVLFVFVVVPILLAAILMLGFMGVFIIVALLGLPLMFLLAL